MVRTKALLANFCVAWLNLPPVPNKIRVNLHYLGTRLATASERGTVIRIFNVADGTRLVEFRFGYTIGIHYLVTSAYIRR